jgi:hypothetical protein
MTQLASAIAMLGLAVLCGVSSGVPPDDLLLFTSFRGNGEDGLHFLVSEDGLTWRAVAEDRSFLRPEVGGKLMRDPHIARGPDGTFHMVWTTAWQKFGVGYSSSRDLVHWSPQVLIDVMKDEPETRNVWAPEAVYDPAARRFVLFWSSTVPGRFPSTASSGDRGYNHRIYFTTTRDFGSFGPTRLLLDPGFNCIDATLVQDGARWVMFLKNETADPPVKKLVMTAAPAPIGPFGPVSGAITGDYWAEGPTAIRLGGRWLVYFDRYREKRYGMVSSSDLSQWREETENVRFPDGHRHGSVVRVERKLVSALVPEH